MTTKAIAEVIEEESRQENTKKKIKDCALLISSFIQEKIRKDDNGQRGLKNGEMIPIPYSSFFQDGNTDLTVFRLAVKAVNHHYEKQERNTRNIRVIYNELSLAAGMINIGFSADEVIVNSKGDFLFRASEFQI